jgi:hypothetical protein
MPDEVPVHREETSRDTVALLPEGPRMTVEGERDASQARPRERDEPEQNRRVGGHDGSRILMYEVGHGEQAAHRIADGWGRAAPIDRREEDISAATERLGDLHAAPSHRAPGHERNRSSGAAATRACAFSPPTGSHVGLVYHS